MTDFSLSCRVVEKHLVEAALSCLTDDFYVCKLPHWHPADTWVFVTWRLAASPPPTHFPRTLPERQRFALEDAEADRATTGPLWLGDPQIAQIVQGKILELSQNHYDLATWVIMANHVHIVILPKIPLRKIMQKLKGTTAYSANKLLGRTGPFWRDESYDHWIRSAVELNSVIRYVERNPVKAGLVDSIEHWKWSGACTRTD